MDLVWEKALEYLQAEISQPSFTAFIKPLKLHHVEENEGIVYLAWTDREQLLNHVKNKYLPRIESAIKESGNRKFRVVIKPEKELNSSHAIGSDGKSTPDLKLEKLFNPRFCFENFVVGKCNQFAHAISLAVAETPGEVYNPVFIYGGSGLGKTHLMQAIGIHIIRNNPSAKVLYVSSEMFTNELITSLGKKNARAFRNKYRKLDVLLIDDVQFLEGKKATQDEFFHTFEALYQENKQIVITCDRPPTELQGLDDRLRSRFGWNMIADVQPPDYETRVAILENLAKKVELEITPEVYDVLCMIASQVRDNIRELEGSFNRVVAMSNLLGTEINVDNAKSILKDVVQNNERAVAPERIKAATAKYYGIKIADMDSKKRNADIALPRMVAMYLIRENTDLSYADIGKLFGDRNHATVIHGIDKIEKNIQDDAKIRKAADDIMKQVKKRT